MYDHEIKVMILKNRHPEQNIKERTVGKFIEEEFESNNVRLETLNNYLRFKGYLPLVPKYYDFQISDRDIKELCNYYGIIEFNRDYFIDNKNDKHRSNYILELTIDQLNYMQYVAMDTKPIKKIIYDAEIDKVKHR